MDHVEQLLAGDHRTLAARGDQVRELLDSVATHLESLRGAPGRSGVTASRLLRRASLLQERLEAVARRDEQQLVSAGDDTCTGCTDFGGSGSIAGRVVDLESGEPLAGVSVWVHDANGNAVRVPNTDADGYYLAEYLLGGVTHFARTSNAQGFIEQLYAGFDCPGWQCEVLDGTPIAVESGQTTTGVDFALARGGRIAGTVVSEGGIPPPSFGVAILDHTGTRLTSAYAETDGSYLSRSGLPTGTYFALAYDPYANHLIELYDDIPCPGYECEPTTGTAIPVTAPQTTSGIDFALSPGGTITGTITDELTGLPIEHMNAELVSERSTLSKSAEPSGYYEFRGLEEGVYFVGTNNSQGYLDEVFDDVVCPAGCDERALGTPLLIEGTAEITADFALQPGGRIAGRLIDAASGNGVAGGQCLVYDETGDFRSWSLIEPSGDYITSSGLETGNYLLFAYSSAGYVAEVYDDIECMGGLCKITTGTPIPVVLGQTTANIDVALDRGGRIAGEVVAEETGEPVDSYVYVFTEQGELVTLGDTYYNEGQYLSEQGLLAGDYYARTDNGRGFIEELYHEQDCPGGLCDETDGWPIAVSLGATTFGIDFTLAAGGTISGRVVDEATQEPVDSVWVEIFNQQGELYTQDYASPTGDYTSPSGLVDGTYFVRATPYLGNHAAELYDDIPCPHGICEVTAGTPVAVQAGAPVLGIDFQLGLERLVFADGFETGDLSAWSAALP